jgi:CDP-diglyceride synthetase
VAVAIFGCVLGVAIQKFIVGGYAQSIARADYARLDVLVFGSVMGITAMLGELPNSFVKRQLDVAPGKTATGGLAALFYVWDQIDLLLFSLPALSCWARVDSALICTGFVVTLVLHPLTSLVGYLIGARRSAR